MESNREFSIPAWATLSTDQAMGSPSPPTTTPPTPNPNGPNSDIHNLEAQIRQLEEEDSKTRERNALIRERILNTYRQVWDAFYAWEREYSRQMLQSVAGTPSVKLPISTEPFPQDPGPQPMPEQSSSTTGPSKSGSNAPDQPDTATFISSSVSTSTSSQDLTFTVTDFTNNETQTFTCSPSSVVVVPPITPYPKYESCAPTNCIVVSNTVSNSLDDGTPNDIRFVKYAGEPGFNEEEYLAQFPESAYAWKRPRKDPDLMVIYASTLSQLGAIPDPEEGNVDPEVLTYGDVDRAKVLPVPAADIVFAMSQRDPLIWPGLILEDGKPALKKPPPSKSLLNRVERVGKNFCSYHSCVTALCFSHSIEIKPHPYPPPTVKNDRMFTRVTESCGEHCFIWLSDDDASDDNLDTTGISDPQLIKELLTLSPDAWPCDIAVVGRVKCSEVFRMRRHLYPDHKIQRKRRPGSTPPPEFFCDTEIEHQYEDIDMPVPCMHEGPCDNNSGCSCFNKNMHCKRTCYCDADCHLMWRGCQCKNCAGSCHCKQAGWECIPQVCHTTAGHPPSKSCTIRKCTNTAILSGHSQPMEVKPAFHGFGTFAAARIQRKAFIGEYRAEEFLYNNKTREPLQKFTGLNYNFAHSKDYTLDAISIGNETRYFNHASIKESNVEAKVKMVDGRHRIGFWAKKTIPKGAEMLFNYGEYYWLHKSPDQGDKIEEGRQQGVDLEMVEEQNKEEEVWGNNDNDDDEYQDEDLW